MARRVFVLPMALFRHPSASARWVEPAYVRELGLEHECISNARSFMLASVMGDEKALDDLASRDGVYEPAELTADKRSSLEQELTRRGITADLTKTRERLVPDFAAAIDAKRNRMTQADRDAILAEIEAKATTEKRS